MNEVWQHFMNRSWPPSQSKLKVLLTNYIICYSKLVFIIIMIYVHLFELTLLNIFFRKVA